MQENEWPDYDRAPIDPLKKLCAEGLLRPVMDLNGRSVGQAREASLDVHFRGNEIHVYCGHARVFRIRFLQQAGEVEVEMGRADDQSATPPRWPTDADPTDLKGVLNRHLQSVNVDAIVKGEGILQARWAGLGHGDEAGRPWTTIDREVQLSYAGVPADVRAKAEERIVLAVGPARRTINEIADRPPRWRFPPDTGSRLDQLAVDEDGNLVLVEIKDAGSARAELYYAPLQLLRYVHLWHVALRRLALWERVRALIDARRACRLTPDIPSLSGGIRAAVCFGSFGDKPSEEVKRRFYEVMGVVNAHVPHGVPPIETWKYDEAGQPAPL